MQRDEVVLLGAMVGALAVCCGGRSSRIVSNSRYGAAARRPPTAIRPSRRAFGGREERAASVKSMIDEPERTSEEEKTLPREDARPGHAARRQGATSRSSEGAEESKQDPYRDEGGES